MSAYNLELDSFVNIGFVCSVCQKDFMYKFKKGILPVNFNPYFTSINKIHNHSRRFSETNYFFP